LYHDDDDDDGDEQGAQNYNLFGSHTFVFQKIHLCSCELDCLRRV